MNLSRDNCLLPVPVGEITSSEWKQIQAESAALLARYCAQTKLPYCNIYVRDRLCRQKIYIPPGLTANEINIFLNRHPETWRKIPKRVVPSSGFCAKLDHRAAHGEAASGRTVLVVYQNPAEGQAGHIALLNASAGLCVSGPKYWGCSVVAVDGYNPKTRRVETGESLSKQFSPQKEPFMDYFVFTGFSNP